MNGERFKKDFTLSGESAENDALCVALDTKHTEIQAAEKEAAAAAAAKAEAEAAAIEAEKQRRSSPLSTVLGAAKWLSKAKVRQTLKASGTEGSCQI